MHLTERETSRLWEKIQKGDADQCWEWKASKTTWGYGQFGWRGRIVNPQHLLYVMQTGKWPTKGDVQTTCGNKTCCNPAHLSGLPARRSIPRPKGRYLPDDKVKKIREEYNQGFYTQRGLAIRWGVHQEWVGQVVRGERRLEAGGPLTVRGRGRQFYE